MAVLPVIQGDDETLRIVSQDVNPTSETLPELVSDLIETMKSLNTASLSAIQCGVPLRLFVTDVLGEVQVWMNPRMIEQQGNQVSGESCVSFPDVTLKIERPETLVVEVNTETGVNVREVTGLLARLVAHELDHLNGKLAPDHLAEEDFYAQLLGTAYMEGDGQEGMSQDTRFDFLRQFQHQPLRTSQEVPTEESGEADDVVQVLDLMADGTWKWVLAAELLKDMPSSLAVQERLSRLEDVLKELSDEQEFWENKLLTADASEE